MSAMRYARHAKSFHDTLAGKGKEKGCAAG
jgi:hypothetical protein